MESGVNGPLRILHLEDDPRDAELVQSTLEAEGLDCHVLHVHNRAAFEKAVSEEKFDLCHRSLQNHPPRVESKSPTLVSCLNHFSLVNIKGNFPHFAAVSAV